MELRERLEVNGYQKFGTSEVPNVEVKSSRIKSKKNKG